MEIYLDTTDSPAGPVRFAVDAQGALVGLRFLEGHYDRSLEALLEQGGYVPARDPRRTAAARQQLEEYAAGTRRDFQLPLALAGTTWQLLVWQALLAIPYGAWRTYGEIAVQVGRPGAARAVGNANAANRLPLVVPCHRVLGAGGALAGFAGGTQLKERLLAHERGCDVRRPGPAFRLL